MNNIEQEISNNLYEFYDQIAVINRIPNEKQDHWSVIQNTIGTWPRIIYRIAPEIAESPSSNLFTEKVNWDTYPEILIAGDKNIQQIDPFLRNKGFYPFAGWKGMAITKELWQSFIQTNKTLPKLQTDKTFPKLPENIGIVKIESPTEIEQWIKVVTSQLVAPALLDYTLVESLIAQPQFEAFLLKHNGVGVSTILVFNSEHSTGLYLIATEKSAQRQGFAHLLVQQVLSREMQRSTNPIVLHATQKGEALYSKLGFKPYNQFYLYRSINMNRV
jgi:GNAT superfamily N-acetyltransferase